MPHQRDSDPFPTLSTGEKKILIFSLICTSTIKGKDTIDWEKLASLCGYTHSTTQRTYSIARRKLREFDEANDSAITARPTGRKSNADASAGSGSGLTTSTFASADNDNGNGNEDDQGTPPKKARKARRNFTPRKRKAEKQEEDSKDGSPATETVADEA